MNSVPNHRLSSAAYCWQDAEPQQGQGFRFGYAQHGDQKGIRIKCVVKNLKCHRGSFRRFHCRGNRRRGAPDRSRRGIGVAGFEPTTSCTQSRRSAKLSYTPRSTSLLSPPLDRDSTKAIRSNCLRSTSIPYRGMDEIRKILLKPTADLQDRLIRPADIGRAAALVPENAASRHT